VITVIGPNGAGKSTLLNALMGVLPSRGEIALTGARDQPPVTLEERVMLGIALVPEKRELFGTMPVEDNLVLGGYRQVRGGKKLARSWSGLQLFPRLKERRAQLAGTLSGGERQMLAVGRALMSPAHPADARRAQPGPGAAGGAEIFRTIDGCAAPA
jgi:branched-chain amino acid transport system ATP-binding protein